MKEDQPGDSSRDLFVPDRWRSRFTFEKGHVNSPSQKGHKELPGVGYCGSKNFAQKPNY